MRVDCLRRDIHQTRTNVVDGTNCEKFTSRSAFTVHSWIKIISRWSYSSSLWFISILPFFIVILPTWILFHHPIGREMLCCVAVWNNWKKHEKLLRWDWLRSEQASESNFLYSRTISCLPENRLKTRDDPTLIITLPTSSTALLRRWGWQRRWRQKKMSRMSKRDITYTLLTRSFSCWLILFMLKIRFPFQTSITFPCLQL